MSQSPPRPSSTYRFQLHAEFTLADARAQFDYLQSLGVTTVYTSPLTQARAGSRHGYDVANVNRLNPELGTDAEFEAFCADLKSRGMTLLVDIVPNHMCATPENPWWADVLAHGRSSPYGHFFDIDFDTPPRAADKGRLVAPVLGDGYGEVLAGGQVRFELDPERGPVARVYSMSYPVDPRSYPALLAGCGHPEVAAAVQRAGSLPGRDDPDGSAGRERAESLRAELAAVLARRLSARAAAVAHLDALNADPERLDRALAAQVYRLCLWRAGSDEINYRRFFDVTDLAALQADRPEVFAATHKLVLDWVARGLVQGLRIDHPDGLRDPAGYLARLQAAYRETAPTSGGGAPPLYVVVEKILAWHEPLRAWDCDGTTGYEFITAATGLLTDPAGEEVLGECHRAFTGDAAPFDATVLAGKFLMLDTSFVGEVTRIARLMAILAHKSLAGRDLTGPECHAAVRMLAAHFPVYRTYVVEGASDLDRADIDAALTGAVAHAPELTTALRFLAGALELRCPPEFKVSRAEVSAARDLEHELAARFQHLTAPATAKGFEDTALYRYSRLLSLNEVGGHPSEFGLGAEAVHRYFARRPRGSLSPLSTHDTKRGEDARARIGAIAELAGDWAGAVAEWRGLNAAHKVTLPDGRVAPSANEEHYFYQALVGSWPGIDALEGFRPRFAEFAVKALHEAKVNSSWRHTDAGYDAAAVEFLNRLLDPARSGPFLDSFGRFMAKLARPAMNKTLAQSLLRVTAPGVPDIYQGSDLLDYSLVDPDNRRAVDYESRRRMLAELDAAAGRDPAGLCRELANDLTGRAKLYLTSRVLRHRRRHAALFDAGAYKPLQLAGPESARLFAFARESDGGGVLVAVPLSTAGLGGAGYAGTSLRLPAPLAGRAWKCVLSDERHGASGGALELAGPLGLFPVACLAAE